MKMPALFVGHGNPMNVLLKNDFTESLTRLGKQLPKPEVILVISAHWLTEGTYVTCVDKPKMIYDIYGFPKEIYQIKYPSPGSPAHARLVTETVKNVRIACGDWGLDHASWTILKHIFPEAEIPVLEMSLDYSPTNGWRSRPVQYYYDLAAELTPLREKGVMIIGSGNIVHNLGLVDFENMDARPYDWAVEFDAKVKQNLVTRNHKELINYRDMGQTAPVSVPTLDHYLPMIGIIALQGKDEGVTFAHEGFQHGSVSMRAFRIG